MENESRYAQFTERFARGWAKRLEGLQERQITLLHRIRDAVDRLLPMLPALPLADRLPAPTTIARANFALAEELLAAQKRYTLSLLEALGARKEKPRAKPR